MRLQRCAAALIVVVALLAGCVTVSDRPESCNDPAVTLRATLADEHLDPGMLDVCRDQDVTLVVTIERDGIFHVHGYDDQLQATEVSAGEELKLTFVAVRSGQFPIALHTTDGPAEVTVGVLTVHEP
jgi:hypothetical protein